MAVKRKPIKARAAAAIREGILDGRSDGKLWGTVQDQGNDTPRWYENRWRGSVISGEPEWLGRAYFAAYERSYTEVQDALRTKMSAEERIEAKRAVEHNRMLRYETRSQREMRLLRERVELAEKRAEDAERKALAAQK